MNELYLANRNLSELYRQKLREKNFILAQSKIFSGQGEINPQVYYLDFKDRVLEFVSNETEILKKECLESDNSHLILLKQTALVDTIVQAAFTSAIWFYNSDLSLFNKLRTRSENVPKSDCFGRVSGRVRGFVKSNNILPLIFD